MSDLTALARADYVLLTTFRKNGSAVATPVWIARDGDALVVGTGGDSGKVKRIRANGRATLQACSARGKPRTGAPVFETRGEVVRDQRGVDSAVTALRAKYRLQYRLMEWFMARRRAAEAPDRVVVRLTAV